MEGSDRAPVRLQGPASRAPELGTIEEVGEDSESSADDCETTAANDTDEPALEYMHESIAENTVAVDPVHDVTPVRLMQALQGSINALQSQAARIIKNEKTPTVVDNDGVLQPVVDEGGRHDM